MKAYTDLEQSKKLSELRIKGADNYYSWHDERYYVVNKDCPYPYSLKEEIPCWSLAALLDILPDRTCVFKKTYKDGRVKYQGVMEGNKELILKDNPIDACYEMVLKLHEQNLI